MNKLKMDERRMPEMGRAVFKRTFFRLRDAVITESFGSLSENTRIFAMEGILYTLIITLANNNNNLYASRLGATASDLGLIASLPPIVGMLSLIPLAVLTDRMHNKKPMVMLSAVGLGFMYVLVGMLAFFNASMVPFLILLLVLVNIPMSLYNSSWQAFFSDVINPCDRNASYSFRTKMNTAVGIFIPLLAGGILALASGSGKIFVHQIYYWLAFPLALGQVLFLKKIKGGTVHKKSTLRLSDVGKSARTLFRSRTFMGFLAVALLVYCGWEMDWSLYFLAQFRYLHMNEAGISLITVLCAVTQFLTIGLWSRLIEKKGIRFVFVIGAGGFAFCSCFLVLSLSVPLTPGLILYYILQSIGSSAYSAFQISVFQCLLEAIPHENRTLSISIYNTVILLSNTIMPYLGIFFYKSLGESRNAMILSIAIIGTVRIFATLAALIRWYRLRGRNISPVSEETPES